MPLISSQLLNSNLIPNSDLSNPDESDTGLNSQGTIAFARLAFSRDAAVLQAEIAAIMQLPWVDHVNRQDYRGGWDVLPLRCQRQHLQAHPILQGFAIAEGDDWQDLPTMDACPAIKGLIAQLQCPIQAVRLMRLQAGAEIKPHRDHQLGLEYGEARLHMPIQTNENVRFSVNHQPVPMVAGELWYINTDQVHAVTNNSAQDRINLVIDALANDWLREQIRAGKPLALAV